MLGNLALADMAPFPKRNRIWNIRHVPLQIIVENFQKRKCKEGAFPVTEEKVSIILIAVRWTGEELLRGRVIEMDWIITRGGDVDDGANWVQGSSDGFFGYS